MAYNLNPTPGDLATARATVERVLDGCERELPTDRSVSVALGWSDEEVVVDDFAGAMGVCLGSDRVELLFSSRGTDWSRALAAAAARQYGRAWLRGEFPDGSRLFWWQDLLEAAAGERLVERVADPGVAPWASLDVATMQPWWPAVEASLGAPVDEPMVDSEEGEAVPAFLAEGIGAVLAAELDLGVDAFPSATRSDVEAALARAFE
ncbi:MAG: hypothetical protein ABEJ57_09240 [Halobacteriaceae archaeon]